MNRSANTTRGLAAPCLFALALAGAFELSSPRAFGEDTAKSPGSARACNLPLYFEAAGEPGDATAGFVARTRSGVFHLTAKDATVVLARSDASAHNRPEPADARKTPLQARRLHLQFLAADPRARITGGDELAGKVNYLLGADVAKWRKGVPAFNKVQVAGLYPGIRLVYYGNEEQLEYDFVVAPGADPRAIAFRAGGADRLRLDARGDLILGVGADELRQHKPRVYQARRGERTEVAGGYRLIDAHTVAFEVGAYDHALPLVIDPVLSYSSFLGGQGGDTGRAIALDRNGNIYVAGDTLSGQLASAGAFDREFEGGGVGAGGDAFVAKFDSSGANLLYLTYLGGSGSDAATSIAVDVAGNAYITGVTDSTNFPTYLAISNSIAGRGEPILGLHPYDAFVTKLSASGSELVYSTYLGGSGRDEGLGIAVDSNFCAYVTGFTESTNFPTANALQRTNGGRGDAFVTKIAPNGRSFVYSTFLGGTNTDHGEAIAVDALGQAHIAGFTMSTNFPVSINAFQPFQANVGRARDAFVTVLAGDGSAVVASTFLGGLGDEAAYGIALDSAGDAFVTGSQAGFGFPVTPGNLNPGGVFKSGNGAVSWTAAGAGLLHNQVYSIGISPNNPSLLYAGTGRGVARSTNAGAAWVPSFNSPTQYVSIAINPVTPATLYAAGVGILKSTDAGTSWVESSSGLPNRPVNKLLLDPHSPGTLYAGTEGSGVYKTTDAAATWVSANSGLGNSRVRDLALNPANPAVVYAAIPSGVYRSSDGGARWAVARQGMTDLLVRALAVDPVTPSTIYAGTQNGNVFKSTDAGDNWAPISAGLSFPNFVRALAIDPQTTTTIYACTTNGLFKSVNAGANWSPANNGLAAADIATVAISPAAPQTLYAGIFGTATFGGLDAFLTKLSPDVSSVIYSLALGGTNFDQGSAVAVDAAGDAFVVGTTSSTNFPTAQTVGLLRATNSGGQDVFVTAINPDASAFLYSAYLGGGSNDFGINIAVDAAGNASVLGQTFSANFPVAGASQAALGALNDAFVAKILLTNAPQTVTLQTVPLGLPLLVDGTPVVSPVTLNWPAGSFHTVSAYALQAGPNGVQYVWTSWSDGGGLSHTVIAAPNATLTASFKTQYFLTMNEVGPGATSPAGGWYDAGAAVPIRAIPASGASFAGWAGSGPGSFSSQANPALATMIGPVTETASFAGTPNNVLTVIISGNGTVAPDYNGQALEVGKSYTLTAKPAKGYLFSGWSGSLSGTGPSLTFVMRNGLVLEATFAPDPFARASGSFAGLFYDTNGVALPSSGFFTATVTGGNGFSARLQSVQRSYSISGRFDRTGFFSNNIVRNFPVRTLSVTLQLDLASGNRLSGQISDGTWVAEVLANRAVYSAPHLAPEGGKKYTLVIPGGADSLGQPAGSGIGTVAVDPSGNVRFSGTLADGTRVSRSTFLSGAGQWPLFASLYRSSGLLLGWLTFTNEPADDLRGSVEWLKPAQSSAKFYPGGFLIEADAVGSLYSFVSGTPVIAFNGGQAPFVLQDGGLAQDLTNHVALDSANRFSNLGPNPLNLTLSTSSGLFQGSMVDPATGKSIAFYGALLQKQNRGAGYFSNTNQVGRVLLGP